MTEELSRELSILLEEGKRRLEENPEAEQVIVVKTAKGQVCHFANRAVTAGDRRDEDAFLAELAHGGETELRALVCLWQGQALDVPSFHFRSRLLELCPNNKDAVVLLQGEDVLLAKKLEVLM